MDGRSPPGFAVIAERTIDETSEIISVTTRRSLENVSPLRKTKVERPSSFTLPSVLFVATWLGLGFTSVYGRFFLQLCSYLKDFKVLTNSYKSNEMEMSLLLRWSWDVCTLNLCNMMLWCVLTILDQTFFTKRHVFYLNDQYLLSWVFHQVTLVDFVYIIYIVGPGTTLQLCYVNYIDFVVEWWRLFEHEIRRE